MFVFGCWVPAQSREGLDNSGRPPTPHHRCFCFLPCLLSPNIACISDAWREREAGRGKHTKWQLNLDDPVASAVTLSTVKRGARYKQVHASPWWIWYHVFLQQLVLSEIKPATLTGQIPLLSSSMTSDSHRQPFKSATLPVCTDNTGYPGKQGMSEHRGAVTTLQIHV